MVCLGTVCSHSLTPSFYIKPRQKDRLKNDCRTLFICSVVSFFFSPNILWFKKIKHFRDNVWNGGWHWMENCLFKDVTGYYCYPNLWSISTGSCGDKVSASVSLNMGQNMQKESERVRGRDLMLSVFISRTNVLWHLRGKLLLVAFTKCDAKWPYFFPSSFFFF